MGEYGFSPEVNKLEGQTRITENMPQALEAILRGSKTEFMAATSKEEIEGIHGKYKSKFEF